MHIKIHGKRCVDTEVFYVLLAVKEDKTREVICNKPMESAHGWGGMLNGIYERGVERVGLICADGLKGLEDVIAEVFPQTPLQRSTTHLKRNIISDMRIGDKRKVAEDLKQVFRVGDRNYTVEKAWDE